MHSWAPFILPVMIGFLLFYPLTTFVLVWVSFLDHPLVCQLSNHHHLPVLAVPHPIPRQIVLFCLLAHRGIFIRIRVDIFSYCSSWHASSNSNSFFPFFGWYVIPARHFPQKSLSENPRIGSPLLPTVRPYPFLPLTHGPPLLYWLGTSWWCLSFVCAPLPCVSIAFLLFIHLPWPEGSSTHSTACLWPLVAWIRLWTFVLYVLLPFWWPLLDCGLFLF